MNSAARKYMIPLLQMTAGLVIGVVIACSPTKFNTAGTGGGGGPLCVPSTTTTCINSGFYTEVTENFKVGAGKVDILFVDDNSASMSPIQAKLKERFSGFIQNLDAKEIDYRIAITTTDLTSVKQQPLITLGNGQKYLSPKDSNRAQLFYSGIIRQETLNCETFIVSMFNTYGVNFQYQSTYNSQYWTTCPSPDTRGIYTPYLVASQNTDAFIRPDANLNVIVISNDEVRQGKVTLEENDRADNFIAMMQQKYPEKYWDFNSLIVKDSTCQAQQVLKNYQGQTVVNSNGPAVSGGIGVEYAKVSMSPAKDINGNPRPRGMTLDICQNDYAQHFSNIATQISASSRLKTLKCKPSEAPVIRQVSNPNLSVPYSWDGNQSIVFEAGSEGIPATIKYRCYTGPT